MDDTGINMLSYISDGIELTMLVTPLTAYLLAAGGATNFVKVRAI